MKKKILLVTILCVALLPCTAKANKNPYYTLKGTVHNFSYTMEYKDGTVLKGKGYDICTSDGSIWEMSDTDTDQFFKEGQKVKIRLDDNGTPKNKMDDIIISIKKTK